ncbi:ATP-binding cassette subfamily C protein [Streptosporangium becharense]|uniref:ATP-binding cassette subfamily C protein n=1 Tax=Streptosporangium becharense TaxID=1816182 RepID=A0A7W9IM88_9ACTN|nr:ABC transporter ATP-binding protein [Streptosporangium becharense]MBB2911558.1 ATP-binding cassette subfamily C protein [Streptosporangium becharense]MBB5822624.1 ATP-binding cassette subfamily C protein [Streptosporangium becharense]
MGDRVDRPVRRALRRDPYQLVRLGAWSAAETAPALVAGLAVARAVDDGFAAGRPVTGFAWLAVLGGTWLLAAAGARQVVMAVAAIVEPFREDLLARVVDGALRGSAASGRGAGPAAVARSNLQVELARDALASVITVVRSFAFTVVSVALGLVALVPEVLALVLPPFAAGLGLFLLSLRALARRQRDFILADERTAEELTGMAGGLRDIAACRAEERVAAGVGLRVAEQARAARSLARVTALRTLSLAVGGRLPVLLVLIGTPWLIGRGAGPGVILGALVYVTQSLAPALDDLVEGLGINGVRLKVALDRLLRDDGPLPAARRRVPALDGGAELRGVTFAYGPHAEPVIDRLDLSVPEGDHIAVVGPSGIGKSTLAALLSGVLRPDSGLVLVGGVPADRLDPADRVLIPQEAYVFRGTLLANLTYLARAPREAVDEAVAAVGLSDLVERLGGYDAEIGSGLLSPAERQLVALARAYLAPARLVILDEATCHLDPAAEARAERAFAERGGTLLVVAHRLTSALRARRVLVMDGTSVRLGTHEEMLTASPLYADLAGHWNPSSTQELVP